MTALLVLVALVVGLDEFLLAPLLTPIGQDFGVAPERVALMVAAYNLPLALLAPVFGRLSDRIGRLAVLRPALAGFALASFATALAPNLPAALAARALTGIAAAGMLPVAFAVASEAENGAGAIARVQTGLTLGIILGPLNGAVSEGVASWRMAFAGLGVVAAVLAITSRPAVPRTPAPAATSEAPRHALARALPGVAAMFLGLGGAIGTFALMGERVRDLFGWDTAQVSTVLAGFGAMTVAGNLIAPVLMRRLGAPRAAALGLWLVLAGIVVLFVPAMPDAWLAASALALWAVFGGAAAPALQAALAEIGGGQRGLVLAVGSSGLNLGVALASAGVAELYARHASFVALLACLTVLPAALVLRKVAASPTVDRSGGIEGALSDGPPGDRA